MFCGWMLIPAPRVTLQSRFRAAHWRITFHPPQNDVHDQAVGLYYLTTGPRQNRPPTGPILGPNNEASFVAASVSVGPKNHSRITAPAAVGTRRCNSLGALILGDAGLWTDLSP